MNNPNPDHPRFEIPQTEHQVRTILHKYPVDLTVKVVTRYQVLIFASRIFLFILVASPLLAVSGGINFALSLTAFTSTVFAMFTIAFALILPSFLRSSIKPFQNLSRIFAIDQTYLWFQMSDGSFSQSPIVNIHGAWFQNDSLVLAINKALFIVIPISTFPNPADQKLLKEHLLRAGKLGKLNILGSIKTIEGRN